MADKMSQSEPSSDSRRQMGGWAYAAMLVGIWFVLVLLILGVFFLIDVAVKGWP